MSENLMFMQMLKSYRATAPMIPEIIRPNDDLEKYYFDFVEKENQVDEFIKDCISPRSAGETFLAEFLKKVQRFCARSSMRSVACHGSISSSRRSSRRAGEMFSRFHTAQAGTVSFSSGIKVRFLLAGS